MGRTCCHVSLAFILKCFNFLQAFVGVSIIVYSAWMLDRWNHHVPVSPPPPVPALAPSPDLPLDPTGELEGLRKFIEDNIDLCKWIGIIVISTQALSLLLAIILRSMVSTRKTEYDTEEEVGARDRTREPLLNPPANQASGGAHFDLWGARMREKYGLNNSDRYNSSNQSS